MAPIAAPGASGAANEEAEASGVEDGKSERENSWNGSGTGVQSGDARKPSGGATAAVGASCTVRTDWLRPGADAVSGFELFGGGTKLMSRG